MIWWAINQHSGNRQKASWGGQGKTCEFNFGHTEFKMTSDIHAEMTHKQLEIQIINQ